MTYFPYLCNKNGKIIEWMELIRNWTCHGGHRHHCFADFVRCIYYARCSYEIDLWDEMKKIIWLRKIVQLWWSFTNAKCFCWISMVVVVTVAICSLWVTRMPYEQQLCQPNEFTSVHPAAWFVCSNCWHVQHYLLFPVCQTNTCQSLQGSTSWGTICSGLI